MNRDQAREVARIATGPTRTRDLTENSVTAWLLALDRIGFDDARDTALALTDEQRAVVNHRSFLEIHKATTTDDRREMFPARGVRPGDHTIRRQPLATKDQARLVIADIRVRHGIGTATIDPRRGLLERLCTVLASLATKTETR